VEEARDEDELLDVLLEGSLTPARLVTYSVKRTAPVSEVVATARGMDLSVNAASFAVAYDRRRLLTGVLSDVFLVGTEPAFGLRGQLVIKFDGAAVHAVFRLLCAWTCVSFRCSCCSRRSMAGRTSRDGARGGNDDGRGLRGTTAVPG
jgi:hypothetical protein